MSRNAVLRVRLHVAYKTRPRATTLVHDVPHSRDVPGIRNHVSVNVTLAMSTTTVMNKIILSSSSRRESVVQTKMGTTTKAAVPQYYVIQSNATIRHGNNTVFFH